MHSRRVEDKVWLVLDDLQLQTDQTLDRSKVIEFLVVTERKGNPGSAGPGRATDPVNVRLGDVGYVEVDDVRDLVDVYPARGDVGCDEHRHPA